MICKTSRYFCPFSILCYFLISSAASLYASETQIPSETKLLKRGLPEDGSDASPAKRIRISSAEELGSFADVEIENLIAKNTTTIVFVDLDGTLVRRKLWFDNLHEDDRKRWIKFFYKARLTDFNLAELKDFWTFLQNRGLSSYEPVLVEKFALEFLEELSGEGAIIVGLTARPVSGADFTHKSLKNHLGMDFKALSRMGKISANGCRKSDGFRDGIFYTDSATNGYAKVTIIPRLVNLIKNQLKLDGKFNIFHFDDNDSEIEPFARADFSQDDFPEEVSITPIHYVAFNEMLEELWEDKKLVLDELTNLYEQFKEKQKPADLEKGDATVKI